MGLFVRLIPKPDMKIGKSARVVLRVLINLFKRNHTKPPLLFFSHPRIAKMRLGC
jgi:hypothetical protein